MPYNSDRIRHSYADIDNTSGILQRFGKIRLEKYHFIYHLSEPKSSQINTGNIKKCRRREISTGINRKPIEGICSTEFLQYTVNVY